MTISFHLRAATAWAEADHELVSFQHNLSRSRRMLSLPQHLSSQGRRPVVTTHSTSIVITGDDWSFSFDRVLGYLTSWIAGGTRLLEPDPKTGISLIPGIWRPPTNNDESSAMPYWKRFSVQALTSQLRSFKEVTDSNSPETVRFTAITFLSPPSLAWGIVAEQTYMISPSGILTVEVKLKPEGSTPTHVPRMGLDIQVNEELQKTNWYGLGPGESYPDKQSAQKIGVWQVGSIAELETRYDVPQAGGNRMETRWVTLTSTKGTGLRATSSAPFSWQASRYTAARVETAKHPCDLVGHEEPSTLLHLDRHVAGVGSAACGPGPREDSLVHMRQTEFAFVLERFHS